MVSFIRKNKEEVLQVNREEELYYLTFPSFSRTGLVNHMFTTRLGGVSQGIYATMNLSFNRGDEEAAVFENFRRVAHIMDGNVEDMVLSDQTHTTNIRKVTEEDMGKGICKLKDYADVDGLVTSKKGIILGCFFADCVPLYFLDTNKKVIGLAHSGWRGTVNGMGRKMITFMEQEYGCRKEDIIAAIGPSICKDCYEVSEDVADLFSREFGPRVLTKGKTDGKYQLDLWKANELVLQSAGLCEEQISVTDICTCCNSTLLFSHRASMGKRGNLGAFMSLR
ncbi:MAG: peptidoglycan editing factor PgeF [Lachnospiraceae bacterium]